MWGLRHTQHCKQQAQRVPVWHMIAGSASTQGPALLFEKPLFALLNCLLCCPSLPFALLAHAAADKDRRYVVHAVNRYAEIFLAYSNGTQVAAGLGNTRVSLQSMMHVTTVASVNLLVASEPVSSRRGLGIFAAVYHCLSGCMRVVQVLGVVARAESAVRCRHTCHRLRLPQPG